MKSKTLNDINVDTVVFINKHYKTKSYGTFIILNKYYRGGKRGRYVYSIKFDKTGYIKCNVELEKIRDGRIKDPYYPKICGVACYGVIENINIDHAKYKSIYIIWLHMIYRCYKKSTRSYKTYGARGIYVCDRWLCFENFYYDFFKLSGYDLWYNNPGVYHLDKDIIPYQLNIKKENKCYCPDYCCLVSYVNNTIQQSLDNGDWHTSKYIGVSARINKNNTITYLAYIEKDGNRYNCGSYDDEIAAANARNRAAINLYGNSVYINDVLYMNYKELMQHCISRNMDDVKNNLMVNMCKIIDNNMPYDEHQKMIQEQTFKMTESLTDKEVQPKKRVMCRIINKEERNNNGRANY